MHAEHDEVSRVGDHPEPAQVVGEVTHWHTHGDVRPAGPVGSTGINPRPGERETERVSIGGRETETGEQQLAVRSMVCGCLVDWL